MKVKQDKIHDWSYTCAINCSSPYGHCVTEIADAWATEMEKCLDKGETVEQCADRVFREVDARPGFGITGFMYGCAVSILADVWEHGEELRRWHNLKTQIHHEGERANEEGKTLNPALLNIG